MTEFVNNIGGNSSKMMHIAAEVTILGAVIYYYNNKIKALNSEINSLRVKLEETKEETNQKLNALYASVHQLSLQQFQKQNEREQGQYNGKSNGKGNGYQSRSVYGTGLLEDDTNEEERQANVYRRRGVIKPVNKSHPSYNIEDDFVIHDFDDNSIAVKREREKEREKEKRGVREERKGLIKESVNKRNNIVNNTKRYTEKEEKYNSSSCGDDDNCKIFSQEEKEREREREGEGEKTEDMDAELEDELKELKLITPMKRGSLIEVMLSEDNGKEFKEDQHSMNELI